MYTILTDRTIIKINGEDRVKFLQGLISNDSNKISSTELLYACMLTPQGKYFADLFLKAEGSSILIDLPLVRLDEIIKKLSIYKLRSDVNFIKSPEYKVISFIEESPDIGLVDPRSSKMGTRGFLLESQIENLTPKMENNPDAYDVLRIDNFIAEGEKDLVAGQAFPLEYGMDELNAIDYKKGCYVGQELVARTHYLGELRKKIVQITSVDKLPALGTLIHVGDKKVGIICSSVANKGLALVRVENVINLAEGSKIMAESQEISLKFKENI